MGFKSFYRYSVLLENLEKDSFNGRGEKVPTPKGFTTIVKDPIPEDLQHFPSVTENPTERRIKAFADREHLYIFDARFDHHYILQTNPQFRNLIALNCWIEKEMIMVFGSGHVGHHTKQEIHMINNHPGLKRLFGNTHLNVRLETDPKQTT